MQHLLISVVQKFPSELSQLHPLSRHLNVNVLNLVSFQDIITQASLLLLRNALPEKGVSLEMHNQIHRLVPWRGFKDQHLLLFWEPGWAAVDLFFKGRVQKLQAFEGLCCLRVQKEPEGSALVQHAIYQYKFVLPELEDMLAKSLRLAGGSEKTMRLDALREPQETSLSLGPKSCWGR